MSSQSSSAQHEAIHDVKASLAEEARLLKNNQTDQVGHRIKTLLSISNPMSATELWLKYPGVITRLLTDTLTTSERRKIREMGGVSDVSKIKNHQQRMAAQSQDAMKGGK